jgi:hypothetical protein
MIHAGDVLVAVGKQSVSGMPIEEVCGMTTNLHKAHTCRDVPAASAHTYTRTTARTHARTHTHTHNRTHTHTHTHNRTHMNMHTYAQCHCLFDNHFDRLYKHSTVIAATLCILPK